MAARAVALGSHDIVADCRRVSAPTLVVTGEAGLDRVVPVESTATYLQFISGARSLVLERTGHFGTITRPQAFADVVYEFAVGGVASAFGRTGVA
jgi:pimeloyl-ACP methyl ester carboxylesterase